MCRRRLPGPRSAGERLRSRAGEPRRGFERFKETLIYSKLKQKGNAASPNEALLNKFSGKNF
jgi:hypothetical protein